MEIRNRSTAPTDKSLYPDEGSSHWDIHDNVVRYVNGANWIRMWTPAMHDAHVRNTCSDVPNHFSNATDSTVEQAFVVPDDIWPEEARSIMANVGPGATLP
ncbi:hypothetical protein [Streptomyces sp. NPDC057682]|uniref:hypothetical protein n=1 Tax=Streptomyces sp. NPDC057682 TaxID=3346210 RepID=UPI003698BF08